MPSTAPSRLRWLKRHRWWLLALLVILAGLGWWYRAASKPAAVEVLTAPVSRGDIEVSVLATGVIEASQQVDVGAQASGQVTKLAVELGDRVKKGQLLAEIDPTLSQNSLQEAQASLDNLLAQQTSAQLELKLAEQENARQQEMLAADATARKDADDAAIQLNIRRAQIAQIAAQIKQSQIKLDTARANVGYTRILAPMDGEVVSITTKEGQTVIATQQAPTILTLANMDVVQVRAQVAEADVPRLKSGMPVYFTVLGAPERKIVAKLKTIQPKPETVNNAIFYNALFDVPNPDGLLKLQMTAQVSFVIDAKRDVLTIPVTALMSRGDGSGAGKARDASAPRQNAERPRSDAASGVQGKRQGRKQRDDGQAGTQQVRMVRVQKPDGTVEPRRVTVGLNNNVQVEVVSGLAEGEQVVTGGGLNNVQPRQRQGGPMGGPRIR
ncbi:MacA family efflux pump subunit [Chitiniphilus shinanonensis]|uniref:MacA family efflux pump subunit n=1 Tax=Chitiniphilus shinanonensis TaxID=553088 RepID=A0ABQ6BRK8_9NEIS|nr:macrolide transporter subunit MacA [Chitiniphilus shinanonensis]GLS03146.1 MacA family efflux pump subunit [Chitiniphilus shinanonensis]